MYTIKVDQFEGPLGLLLELIEEKKLEITNVSLAEVTNQFLDYLKGDDNNITAENLASFLVTASILILIKSKALLPFLELTREEEDDIHDLEKQLKEYQRFKRAAEVLKGLFKNFKIFFVKERKELALDLFYPPKDIDSEALRMVFASVLDDIVVIPELPKDILKLKISIEDKINFIAEIVKKRIKITFDSLKEANQGKDHFIANFLAMLELTRQKLVALEQDKLFGEIRLLRISDKEEIALEAET